jgi:hypothetical protein
MLMESTSEPFWDFSRMAQNLAFSMLVILLPLQLTLDMSNFALLPSNNFFFFALLDAIEI